MNDFTANNLAEKLTWQEHIRKRPGMYLGQVNHKGYIETLKKLITKMVKYSGCDTVRLLFKDKLEGEIEFYNIQSEVRKDISIINQKDYFNAIDLPILNALSEWMNIIFDSDENGRQQFKNGQTEIEPSNDKVKCNKLNISYSLDKSIWGEGFMWNSNYLSYELREFCYLNSSVKFEITEKIDDFSNTNTFKFENGLSDRLVIEILNAIGNCYFKHHFTQVDEKFKLEIAFAFRQYSNHQTFIKSYVNNEITPENGSHLDGLLKGVTDGIMKHLQAQDLVNDYKISKKGIQQELVCLISIQMDGALFSGSMKNQLANSEIIKPIANYVSELLYDSMLKDKESTEKLLDKYKIRKV